MPALILFLLNLKNQTSNESDVFYCFFSISQKITTLHNTDFIGALEIFKEKQDQSQL